MLRNLLLLVYLSHIVYAGKVILLGDSLTEIAFFQNGWATALQKIYDGEISFIDNGRGGYTTNWTLPLLKPSLDKHSKDHLNPLLLTVIFLGTNDAFLNDVSRTVSVQEYTHNLNQMVEMAMKYAKVMLVTPPPIDETRDKTRTLLNTKKYRDACIRTGEKYNVPTLDTWSLIMPPNGDYNQDIADDVFYDGVHFTTAGHFVMAVGIAHMFRGILPNSKNLDYNSLPIYFGMALLAFISLLAFGSYIYNIKTRRYTALPFDDDQEHSSV
ncbi:SGNH hydrolase-type esterase domain-containing protein [Globomyces pollinis-pini]|nr:SGNH hydrolase-type esterase domain-containing protein [Globomyces pollinis-pini]